jgi:GNAT superfamily N-acetyltransferase
VIEGWAPPITDESVEAFVENPDQEICLVGELDGEIVGIGSVVPHLNELRACYVSPKGLRKGVGTRIVRELERIAVESGVRRLESVSTVTAVPFYRSLGYNMGPKVQHLTSTGVTMDSVEMSKELAS